MDGMIGSIFNLKTEPRLSAIQRIVLLILCCLTLVGIVLSFYPINIWLSDHPAFIDNKSYINISKYLVVLRVALLSPILEELIFRLPLRFNITYVRISFIGLVFSQLLRPE